MMSPSCRWGAGRRLEAGACLYDIPVLDGQISPRTNGSRVIITPPRCRRRWAQSARDMVGMLILQLAKRKWDALARLLQLACIMAQRQPSLAVQLAQAGANGVVLGRLRVATRGSVPPTSSRTHLLLLDWTPQAVHTSCTYPPPWALARDGGGSTCSRAGRVASVDAAAPAQRACALSSAPLPLNPKHSASVGVPHVAIHGLSLALPPFSHDPSTVCLAHPRTPPPGRTKQR